jgi:sporulation protein YlmC with PRC-barrel domain
MPTLDDVRMWRGKTMIDADGDTIGTIEDVYVDRHTGRPAWAAVRTGLFGITRTVVPILDAAETPDEEVRVPYDKDAVKDAPQIDPDAELSHDEERAIWRHYGLTDDDEWKGEEPAEIVRLRRLVIADADGATDAEDGRERGEGWRRRRALGVVFVAAVATAVVARLRGRRS